MVIVSLPSKLAIHGLKMVVTNYVLAAMILQVPCQCPNVKRVFFEGISPSLSLNNPLNKAGDFLKGYLWGRNRPHENWSSFVTPLG